MVNGTAGRANGGTGPSSRATRVFTAAALVSLAVWGAAEGLAPRETLEWTPQMHAAAERMAGALTVVRRYRDEGRAIDPNRTGLIGPGYAELFTTLGQLEAKRTTTNPDVAALLVFLLEQAGVGPGDGVAVGASASFPALLVATLTAAEALGAHPVTILSLGASSHGLTDPAFDLLSLHQLLVAEGVVRTPPTAVSPGGARDVGEDFEPHVREALLGRMRASGVPLILEADLPRNVALRMEVYSPTGPGMPVAGFVNIGGADANVGTSPTILGVRPGLLDPQAIPDVPEPQRGVLHAMAVAGVPVIHLLDVRTLARRHGLPWDPVPLPEPGATRLTTGAESRRTTLLAIAGIWLAAMVILGAAGVIIPKRKSEPDPP